MEDRKKREKKIFDAIQQLKDAVFGMESSYAQYCYSMSERRWKFDPEKANQFISELIGYAVEDPRYAGELEPLIRDFLIIVLEYLDCTFASNEYKFCSIRKIAYATWKETAENVSTFDVLITDVEKDLSADCFQIYKKFTNAIVTVDQDAFYICIKHALEKFVDENGLSCIDDEDAVDQMVARIRQLAYRLKVDNRQFVREKAEKRDDE